MPSIKFSKTKKTLNSNLKVKEQVSVVIEQLGMELVNHGDSVHDLAALDCIPDPDPGVHFVEIDGRWNLSLGLKLFCCFFESL